MKQFVGSIALANTDRLKLIKTSNFENTLIFLKCVAYFSSYKTNLFSYDNAYLHS